MNLMDPMGGISDKHITEFAFVGRKKRHIKLALSIASAAACLAVGVTVAMTAFLHSEIYAPGSSVPESEFSSGISGSFSDSSGSFSDSSGSFSDSSGSVSGDSDVAWSPAPMIILGGISYVLDGHSDLDDTMKEYLPDKYVLVGEALCSGRDNLGKEGFVSWFGVGDEIYQDPENPGEVFVHTQFLSGEGIWRYIRCITNELRMAEEVIRDYGLDGRTVFDTKLIDLDSDGEDELLVLTNQGNARVFEVWEKNSRNFYLANSFGAGKANFIDTLSLRKAEYNGETVYLYSFAYDEGGTMKADEVLSVIRKTEGGYETEHILSRGTLNYLDIAEPFTKEFYRKGWSKYDIGMSGDYGDITKEEYDKIYEEIMGTAEE